MRNILNLVTFVICFFMLQYDYTSSTEDNKKGCLDESAINYCLECITTSGNCLYDNEPSYRCEEPLVRWKKRWSPLAEFQDRFVVFTISRCWSEWEVTIYDFKGNEIWFSYDPTDEWDGKTLNGAYVEAGTYLLSIKSETRGKTKKIDILTELEIFFDSSK